MALALVCVCTLTHSLLSLCSLFICIDNNYFESSHMQCLHNKS